MEKELNEYVEFASQVMELSIKSYNLSDTLNGLALAAAAALIELVSDDNLLVDKDGLDENLKKFLETVSRAVDFALDEVKNDDFSAKLSAASSEN